MSTVAVDVWALWMVIPFYICRSVYWRLLWALLWMTSSFCPIPSSPSQIPCSTFPVTLFVSLRAKYLKVHLCCVALKAMKMSRRSADASQRALAYSRMVEGLNEFRLGNNSHSPSMTQTVIIFVLCLFLSWANLQMFHKHLITWFTFKCLSLH